MTDAVAPTPDERPEPAPVWHAGHVAQRTVGQLVAFYVLVAAFCGSLLVPGVSTLLGVTVTHGLFAFGGPALVSTVASITYLRSGVSKVYLAADALETYAIAAAYTYLIYTAGSSRSFFWLLYMTHVPIIASSGAVSYNRAVVIGVPAVLTAARLSSGDVAGAALSATAGTLGHLTYSVLAKITDELETARLREAELKLELVRLSVSKERGRIAQDLHDSVGAQLTGLVWRVRALATRSNDVVQGDLAGVESRIVSTIEELRDVVMSLRRPPETWSAMIGLLRERSRELLGDLAFDFHAPKEAPVASHAAYANVALIVLELVRNAARHAAASKVEVRVDLEPGALTVGVRDDGRGLGTVDPARSRGGLGNVWRRVADLGGRVRMVATERGAHFEIVVPLSDSGAHQ